MLKPRTKSHFALFLVGAALSLSACSAAPASESDTVASAYTSNGGMEARARADAVAVHLIPKDQLSKLEFVVITPEPIQPSVELGWMFKMWTVQVRDKVSKKPRAHIDVSLKFFDNGESEILGTSLRCGFGAPGWIAEGEHGDLLNEHCSDISERDVRPLPKLNGAPICQTRPQCEAVFKEAKELAARARRIIDHMDRVLDGAETITPAQQTLVDLVGILVPQAKGMAAAAKKVFPDLK